MAVRLGGAGVWSRKFLLILACCCGFRDRDASTASIDALALRACAGTPQQHGLGSCTWHSARYSTAILRPPVTMSVYDHIDLTNRSSQPLAVAMRKFDFMKQLLVFATLAPASGGSAPSR